ncbi:MAG: N-acetyl-gamma-glutamyl-phosphate reductase [Ruminiclostridium sp.]|nr:N-acetyl-gamma-glutamyl-phosphate reductase [Ruminiclostridium sp.]
MRYKIFVDGQEGTTGLKINERLENLNNIEILKIDPEKRKDSVERSKLLNEADIVFLCLPDAAAKESVSLVSSRSTGIIDASTAHRTDDGWAYGFPELSASHREAVKTSKRVSVPGCHATGFNLIMYPLVKEGIVPSDYPVTCHSITGYSGGGKKLIAQYESGNRSDGELISPRIYALGLQHKHLPEMKKVSGLAFAPLFSPIIGDYYQGMSVAVPLTSRLLPKKYSAEEIHAFLSEYYKEQYFVSVPPFDPDNYPGNGYLSPISCNGTNRIELYVFGHDEQILLVARLDNLGKGAAGAAVQCMNIMLGFDETTGLLK